MTNRSRIQTLLIALSVIALFGLVIWRKGPRSHSLAAPTPSRTLKLYDARALGRPDCGLGDQVTPRTVVLTAEPNRHLKINQEDVQWIELQPRLTDIYATRAEKTLYLLNRGLSSNDLDQLERISDGVGIQKLCVLDPTNPIKLPKAIGGAGSDGTG